MTAEEFLNRLQEQGLIDAKSIASLRSQVRGSQKNITAQTIAKLLVDKGKLTAFQAKKIIGDEDPKPPGDSPEPQVGESNMKLAVPEIGDSSGSESVASEKSAPRADRSERFRGSGGKKQGANPPVETEGLTLLPTSSEPNEPPIEASLLDDPLSDAASLEGDQGMLMGGYSQHKKSRFKKKKAGQWDSPLMLMGGAGLLALVLSMGFLVFILTRGNADQLFDLAQALYDKRSYSEAIEKYQEFTDKYPKNEKVSLAKVKKGLALLRLAVHNGNWQRSLDTANQMLPTIENEDSFHEARPELASLLPDIAEAFSKQAYKAVNTEEADMEAAEQNYGLATQSMQLVNNGAYISTELRESLNARLERIDDTLKDVKHLIDQDKELYRAIAEIKELVEQGKTSEAYAARKKLLRTYPELGSHADLKEAVLLITLKQSDLVKLSTTSLPLQTSDEPSPAEYQVLLARPHSHAAKGASGNAVLVMARGTVYGIDSGDGSILWWRFVGYETKFHPLSISEKSGGGAILVDGQRNELLRLRSDNGQLVWRTTIPGSFARPVIHDKSVYVATSNWVIWRKQEQTDQWWTGSEWSDSQTSAKQYSTLPDISSATNDTSASALDSGELIEIDLASGETTRRVVFPQALPAPPAFHNSNSKIYVLGDHSNLYVLSAEDLQCEEVFYFGHKAGDISEAPIYSRGTLLIAANLATDNALLHIVKVDNQGLSLKLPQQRPIELRGHVLAPLKLSNKRVFVATDRGEIHWLDIIPGNANEPVSVVKKISTAPKEPFTPYFLLGEGQLWATDYRLTKFKIQTTLRSISKDGDSKLEGTAFLAPLQKIDNSLILVRRMNGSTGVNVSAVRANDATPLWDVNLGSPLAGPIFIAADGKRVLALSSGADLFDIDESALEAGLGASSVAASASKPRRELLIDQIALGSNRLAFATKLDRQQIVLYDRQNESNPLRWVKLSVSSGTSHLSPVAFGDNLLVCSGSGQVFLLDATGKRQEILPFQPELDPNADFGWLQPAIIGSSGSNFVIADTLGKIYHVGIQKTPRPHLAALKQKQFDFRFVSPLAATGETVYGVVRGETGDQAIASFTLPDLEMNQETPIAGHVVWGPRQIGNAVLIATDNRELFCFDEAHKLRWTTPLTYGTVVGTPLVDSSDFVLISQDGVILRLAGDSGKELAKVELGQPLVDGPVVFSNRLWVNGADGKLFVVPMIAR